MKKIGEKILYIKKKHKNAKNKSKKLFSFFSKCKKNAKKKILKNPRSSRKSALTHLSALCAWFFTID